LKFNNQNFTVLPKLTKVKKFKILKNFLTVKNLTLNYTYKLKKKIFSNWFDENLFNVYKVFNFTKYYFLNLYYTKNNFFLNLNNLFGKLIYQITAGKTKLKGPKKKTFYAYEVALALLNFYLKINYIQYLFINGTGKLHSKLKVIYKKLKYKNRAITIKLLKTIKYNHSTGLKLKKIKRL